MRQFFTTSFIALSFILSVTGMVPVAYAQATTTAAAAAAAPVKVDPAAAPTMPALGGDMNSQMGGIMMYIMMLFAWLVGVAAITLDYATYYTVIIMGTYVKNLTAIGVTWRILRDVGNIMLIFGFLAIGITTILDVDWYGGGKKMLVGLILAAVFLNFSLFFTEAVIDVGNLFATQFFTQINGGKVVDANFLKNLNTSNEGISNAIQAQLGLPSIYNIPKADSSVFKNQWTIGFMGIILFIITAFVMFSLAFILIARFIYLIFLIILAPVGFAGFAVPQLKGIAKKWQDALVEQTITAPVLFLMLYVALAVITDAKFLAGFGGTSGSQNWLSIGGATANVGSFASVLLPFLVAMGLLVAVTITAKKLGAVGADFATKTAGKLTFGATAWAATRTLSRGAYHIQRYARQNAMFNKIDAFTGRGMTRSLDKVATASFDIRGISALKNLPGGGLNAGDPAKDGFVGARKRTIEDHEKAAKAIETAHKDAFIETKEELNAIKNATADRTRAEEGRTLTQKENWAAIQEMKDRRAEVAKIEAEKKTPDRDTRLAAAKSNLEASEKKQKSLVDSLGKLDEIVKNLKTAESDAKGASGKRSKENINKSKTAYAEGIDHPLNPFNLAYGPGSGAAAKKIKDSMKEPSSKDKLEDIIKGYAKEEAKHEKEAEHKDEHTSAPATPQTATHAAPPAAAAPAGGGHH
jgi:hypothetical protein